MSVGDLLISGEGVGVLFVGGKILGVFLCCFEVDFVGGGVLLGLKLWFVKNVSVFVLRLIVFLYFILFCVFVVGLRNLIDVVEYWIEMFFVEDLFRV